MEKDIRELQQISDRMGEIQLGTQEADDELADAVTAICGALVKIMRKIEKLESQGK